MSNDSLENRSKPNILAILHATTASPGHIERSLLARGCNVTRVYACDAPLPDDLEPFAGVVSFGGPMSANDESLPFIRDELRWLSKVLRAQKPFLGVCLGAQLMARVLGAQVAPHPRGLLEAGYYRVFPTEEGQAFMQGRQMHVYHWHQEGFDLPRGAVLLATSNAFPNQAYRYTDRVYGVQFHPEMTHTILDRWLTVARHKLSCPFAQADVLHHPLHAQHKHTARVWLEQFWDVWLP